METFEQGSFGYDLNFLKEKDSIIVLSNLEGKGQIIISPKYQGKVFTSTADGLEGKSFGWINYDAFDKDPDPHMNAYGGENRLWLGPEGNQFSLFFKPGSQLTFEEWRTPPPIDTEPWKLISATANSVSLQKSMSLQNYTGTQFNLTIEREIRAIEQADINQQLGITINRDVQSVAFSTKNSIINEGSIEWTRTTGAPCLWILDMFAPSPSTVVVIPFYENRDGKIATTDYFAEIASDRIRYKDGLLFFSADGKSRGKLGLSPSRTKKLAASYDITNQVLTLTTFDVDPGATYLNQEWTLDKYPFTGDAVNAYNDGPLASGEQMGPFYELESVSPAAFLKPREKLSHRHNVYHFIGSKDSLNELAKATLNISLNELESVLQQ